MSVLVFLDQSDGHIKKSSFEAASYAAKIAELTGTNAEAIVLGTVTDELSTLGQYGISTVHTVANETLNQIDAQVYTQIIAAAATSINANVVAVSYTHLTLPTKRIV